MTDAISNALADQFSRAWAMAMDAVRRFPEEAWCEAPDERMQPARIAYHILKAAERYTWLGPDDEFSANQQYKLDWVQTPAQDLPSREEALQHLEQAKDRSMEWIKHFDEDQFTSGAAQWPWTGNCVLAQAMYHLRHLQHHMAELNIELRRRGLPTVEWK